MKRVISAGCCYLVIKPPYIRLHVSTVLLRPSSITRRFSQDQIGIHCRRSVAGHVEYNSSLNETFFYDIVPVALVRLPGIGEVPSTVEMNH